LSSNLILSSAVASNAFDAADTTADILIVRGCTLLVNTIP